MSDLVLPVNNGKVTGSNTATETTKEVKNTRGTTDLGQDAFLKLLICEMQNQDPLEPTSNTEWISQMATFSQLEELQSISKASENSQMFTMVGKNVIVKVTDDEGNVTLKSGMVDFISMSGGQAKFSVNGNLYSMSDLYSLVDAEYYYDQCKPDMEEAVEFSFNGDAPEDLTFKVNMGEEIAKATEVAVVVNGAILSPNYVILDGNEVTVKADILQELPVGDYKFSLVFNDKNYTTVDDKLHVMIHNSHPTADAETEEATDTQNKTVEEI